VRIASSWKGRKHAICQRGLRLGTATILSQCYAGGKILLLTSGVNCANCARRLAALREIRFPAPRVTIVCGPPRVLQALYIYTHICIYIYKYIRYDVHCLIEPVAAVADLRVN
jgi:hypothetical protein